MATKCEALDALDAPNTYGLFAHGTIWYIYMMQIAGLP